MQSSLIEDENDESNWIDNNLTQEIASSSKRFPELFDDYKNSILGNDFISFSKNTINELIKKIVTDQKTAASGGYILFLDYNHMNVRFLLIAMLKNKSGVTISSTLEIDELEHIDLKNLSQAARLNFQKYDDYKVADEVAKLDMQYLSFVSPSTNKNAAGYFIEALGCVKGTTSAQATKRVLEVLHSFFKSNSNLPKNIASKVKLEAINYLNECKQQKPSVSAKLSDIETLARKFITSLEEQEQEDFILKLSKELNDEPNCIPYEFPVDSSELHKATHIKITNSIRTIDIRKDAIGINEDAKIVYNREENSITIRDLSEFEKVIMEDNLRQNGLID